MENICYEMCPHCEDEVQLPNELGVYRCPTCGKWIVNCCMCRLCDAGKCDHEKCPLSYEANLRNEEENKKPKNASEKFYERAEELGIDSFKYTRFGHYGVETDKHVIVLVHEDEEDGFDELRYPLMEELSKYDSLREAIFDMYDAIEDFDNETIGALYRWKLFGRDYCLNKYPKEAGYSGVYFACTPKDVIHFTDDK